MLTWNGGGNTPNLNMKHFLILRDTVADKQRVKAGDVVELPEDIGYELCAYGKAEPHTPKAKPAPKKEDRSVGLEKSEEAPKKRAKK